jgi:dipeptidyl aminopeptidase/acylaminoacyl peptidase
LIARASSPSWSPDSRLIAYPGGYYRVRVATPSGAVRWSVPAVAFSWSAKGLLAVVWAGIRVYDAQGRRLAWFRASDYAWSPDGIRLAMVAKDRLEVREGPGLERVVVRKSLRGASGAIWLGRERVMVTVIRRSGRADSVGIDLETGKTFRPSAIDQGDGPPELATAPDGSHVAWLAEPVRGRVALRVSGPGGGGARTLVRLPQCPAQDPALDNLQFLPDGRSLVYETSCGASSSDLYIAAADGSHPRRLTRTLPSEVDATLSPDGSRIAYVLADAACDGCPTAIWNDVGIWTIDVDGSHARQLTSPSQQPGYQSDAFPQWSPDGRWIAFSAEAGDYSHSDLFVVPASGGAARDLHVRGRAAAWTSGGIAYVGGVPGGTESIRMVKPDGTGDRVLVQGRAGVVLGSPTWSREGQLAYTKQESYSDRVSVVEDGGSRFTLRFTQVSSIEWTRDGRHFLVVAGRDSDLYRVDGDGRHLTRLARGRVA